MKKITLLLLVFSLQLQAAPCLEMNEPWLHFVTTKSMYDKYGSLHWETNNKRVYGSQGILAGMIDGNTLKDCQGFVVAKRVDSRIVDETGALLYIIDGNNIKDSRGSLIFTIKGDTIYNRSGNVYGTLK